ADRKCEDPLYHKWYAAHRCLHSFPTRRSSDLEWVQNQEGLMWDVDEVNARLQKIMVRAFMEMVDTMRKHHVPPRAGAMILAVNRSEEHTSELQSLRHLVCRLLLEKKNQSNSTS